MERAVEILVVIQFVLIGLSHMFRPGDWVDFFIWLRAKGHAGVFAHGILSLWFGSIVVAFHPVWSGLPMILTIAGYANLVKAFVCFVFPAVGLRSLMRVSHERAWHFVAAGAIALLFAAVLSYSLYITA